MNSGNEDGSPFERFRRLVLRDVSLQAQLRPVTDEAAFIALTVRLGAERGFVFTEEEVQVALRRERRAWLERHL
jgi:hypothetical protein